MIGQMKYGEDYKSLPLNSENDGEGREVRPDVYMYTDQFANVVFIGRPEDKEFILIDAGTPKGSDKLLAVAKDRFGEDSRAKAILLTHGHFDHVGSVIELAEEWDCPIYAHRLEAPYLTGKESYPRPDGSVQGGLIAKISPTFPTDPIDISSRLNFLSQEDEVPHLPGFSWTHVPGHSPGQVAFFREEDRLLIAADAFVSTRQEALYQVLTQNLEINGPPRYLTTDWEAAEESVIRLQELEPEYAITGHGPLAQGKELKDGLQALVENWDELAVPDYGRYVDDN